MTVPRPSQRWPVWASLLLLLALLVQLSLPAFIAGQKENLLRKASTFKFKIHLRSSYDDFNTVRGHYLRFSLEQQYLGPTTIASHDPEWKVLSQGYALYRQGKDGFAELAQVSAEPPAETSYLRVRVRPNKNGQYDIRFPLDRIYLREGPALVFKQLESEKRKSVASLRAKEKAYVLEKEKVYALVGIAGGMAVLKGIWVNEQPITQYLMQIPAKDSP